MTKRKRTDIELANPTPEVNSRADTTELVAHTGVDANAPREELRVVAEPVSVQSAVDSPTGATTDPVGADGWPPGPFWDLLRQAGFQLC